jgi:hypothetical protein
MINAIIPTIVNPEGFKYVVDTIAGPDVRLIVIDNSEDGYADWVKDIDGTIYVHPEENLKVNASWNLAETLSDRSGPLVFLNDDIVFNRPSVVATIAELAHKHRAWVGPEIVKKFTAHTGEPVLIHESTRDGCCFAIHHDLHMPVPGGANMPKNFYGDDWHFNNAKPKTLKLLNFQVIHHHQYSSSRIRRKYGWQHMGDQQDGKLARDAGII